jgi:hypothetical protein
MVNIFHSEKPALLTEVWSELYNLLIQRHGIIGLKVFFKKSFENQLLIPGVVVFCDEKEYKIFGMQFWYTLMA